MADPETKLPPVMWAQIKDSLYITINLQDVQDAKVDFTETTLSFRCAARPSCAARSGYGPRRALTGANLRCACSGRSEGNDYEWKAELAHPIDVEVCERTFHPPHRAPGAPRSRSRRTTWRGHCRRASTP